MHRTFALLLAALLGLAAVARAAPAPLRLAVAVTRSGPESAEGEMLEKGLRLWAQHRNALGGLLGRPVELLLFDDAGGPAETAAIYRRLIETGQAELVLGPQKADQVEACRPVFERAGMPCILVSCFPDTVWGSSKGVYFAVQSGLAQTPRGFLEIASRAGLRTLACLAVGNSNPPNILENTSDWVKRYAVDVVFRETMAPTDARPALERAWGSGAKCLLAWCAPEAARGLVRSLRASPWRPKAVFLSGGAADPAFQADLGRDAEGVFTSAPWDLHAADKYPGGRDFVAAFRQAYARNPDRTAAAAYAAGQVLEAACARLPALDRGRLRQALTDLDTVTVLGRYGVDPAGRQIRQLPLTLQWQKGRLEIVWPDDFRTARPVLPR